MKAIECNRTQNPITKGIKVSEKKFVHAFTLTSAILTVSLSASCNYFHWQTIAADSEKSFRIRGEGLIVRGNGLGYYAWLRSALIDHDLDFSNEFDDHKTPGDYVPPSSYVTPTGFRANQWSVGPACFWSPGVVITHVVTAGILRGGTWIADGYSWPYQISVAFSVITFSLIGIVSTYYICRRYTGPKNAALSAYFIFFGSPIIYYQAVEPSMAHGIGSTCVAVTAWYWLQSYGSTAIRRWFTVGFLIGISALTRWQLFTLLVLPLGEYLFETITSKNRPVLRARLALLAFLGSLISFLPQMIAWKIVYGSWLYEPIPHVSHHWLRPSLGAILLSPDRGLLVFTPICTVAILGFIVHRRRAGLPALLLLGAFVIQVYALGSCWGKGEFLDWTGNYSGVYLAKSYGMRHLTESVVVLAPGIALLLQRSRPSVFRLLSVVGSALVVLNIVLIVQYSRGRLYKFEYIDAIAIAFVLAEFPRVLPGMLFTIIETAAAIYIALACFRESPVIERRQYGPDARSLGGR